MPVLVMSRKGPDGRLVAAVEESTGCLAAAALAAASLLQLDLSCSDWLSTEHLVRCSCLLSNLQAGTRSSIPLPIPPPFSSPSRGFTPLPLTVDQLVPHLAIIHVCYCTRDFRGGHFRAVLSIDSKLYNSPQFPLFVSISYESSSYASIQATAIAGVVSHAYRLDM